MSVFRFLHLAAFVVALAIYTWLLLDPRPPKPSLPPSLWTFLMDKSAHVGGFAALTFIGVSYARESKSRWGVVGLMLLYAIVTEIGQTYTGRHGCIQDVLFDWAGIAIGLLFVRIFEWYRSENPPATTVADSHSPALPPQ